MFNGRKVIGICTAELDHKFHRKLLDRVVRELNALGHYVMIFGSDSDLFYLNDSDIADACVFNVMNKNRVDVVLLFAETIKQHSILMHIVNRMTEADIPVVSIGKELDRCYNILYDTDSAFEQMVRHIVEYHGLKEVNFISGTQGNEIAQRRLDIYHRVLDDNDLPYEEGRVGYGDFWFGPTIKVMDEFIQPGKLHPEAIICANDSMAVTVCDYLREKGIRVPEDVLVAGIDGIDEGMKHTPGITTCVRDEVNDAKTIAGLVQQLCDGRSISGTTVLEYHMQLSQSCGCQKTHLFDADSLISRLNAENEAYRADTREYSEMQEGFLKCRDDAQFWDLVAKYMPDNSFIAINLDLDVEGDAESQERVDGFTRQLRAMVKLEGKAARSACSLEHVVPEAGKDMPYDRPVILLPIHFCERVVGYMGIWDGAQDKVQMERIINFLLHFDQSAGFRLTQ